MNVLHLVITVFPAFVVVGRRFRANSSGAGLAGTGTYDLSTEASKLQTTVPSLAPWPAASATLIKAAARSRPQTDSLYSARAAPANKRWDGDVQGRANYRAKRWFDGCRQPDRRLLPYQGASPIWRWVNNLNGRHAANRLRDFVNVGTVQAGVANALSSSSAFTVAHGAKLDLNNFNQTIGSLAGAGGAMLGTATLTTGNNNASSVETV
jgi:hypothetical protein